ncbi:MAG TPA: hypothetical protein PKW24_06050 [Clostridiales bacterium]|nr:hypothetical protein [Clostridiales bacterium]
MSRDINRLKKNLAKKGYPNVECSPWRDSVRLEGRMDDWQDIVRREG